MKLIRLATDNDGVFQSSFQNDMIIAPNSQMALLNLTFQTNIGVFVIVAAGASITFKSDTTDNDTSQTVTIPNRSYNVGEEDIFYKDIQHALNSSLKNVNARGAAATGYNSVCSAFRIGTTDAGIKTIEYRYAPFLNPVRSFTGLLYQHMIWNTALVEVSFTGDLYTRKTTYNADPALPETDDRTYKVLPLNGRRLNDGSACFSARVAGYVDNASGLQDNGFGIGLSKRNLGVDFNEYEDILPGDLDFEIRFNRQTETYKHIINGAVETNSGLMPLNTTGTDQVDNDLIFMEVSGNQLQIGVYQDDGSANGLRNVFHTHNVVAGEEFYPYLYIRGAKANIKVEAFNFSLDPWLPSLGGDERGNDTWALTGTDDTGLYNGYQETIDGAAFSNVLTKIDSDDERFGTESRAKYNLTMNSAVLRALGFSQFQNDTNAGFAFVNINFTTKPQPFWSVKQARQQPISYTSDNFIVESMSLALDSFDASKVNYIDNVVYSNPANDKMGRRKNILMTIPVNDNTSGIVEYESSTPIFIDIDNANEINAKNLNFRILRKDFSPIIQGEQSAIMTILIKKSKEEL